jgi:hypothetical protein
MVTLDMQRKNVKGVYHLLPKLARFSLSKSRYTDICIYFVYIDVALQPTETHIRDLSKCTNLSDM